MKRLNNEQGSVLVITLSFVLVFMLLGVASTHHAFVTNELTEKEQASTEAFWMADGAMEMAAQKLIQSGELISPDLTCVDNTGHIDYPNCGDADSYGTMGNGFYHVYSSQIDFDSWDVRAWSWVDFNDPDGSTNDQFRGIDAKYGSSDIENALTTHGTVNGGCAPAGSATITGNCVADDPFTFESVFNGMTQADFEALATANTSLSPTFPNQNFILPSSSTLWGIAGITVVHLDGNNNKATFNTDNSAEYDGNPALLIVDTSGYTGNPLPNLTINGNSDFCGIIWAVGEVKIAGTAEIEGAVFVDGDPNLDTPFTGDADLAFNETCVNGALSQFGGTGPPNFYAWNEFTYDNF